MKYLFKDLFIVVLLATELVTLTNCSKQDSETIEETKIALGVQMTLTAERDIEARVEAGIQATQTAIQASVPSMISIIQPTLAPEIDVQATIEAGVQATQAAMSKPEPQAQNPADLLGPVTITSPASGAEVLRYNEVSGHVDKSALAGKFLNVIVTTQTGEHWAQIVPTIQDDGTWLSYPVYIGTETFGIGENFRICAVIADQQLPTDRIYTYPAGSKACIEVIRVK